MNEARVRSIEALTSWRSSLIVFQTKARRGLSQVLDEIKRVRQWLESEQKPFWELEIKKRSRKLDQVNQELITARFSSSMRGTLMVQEQAVRKAKAALAEAEEKLRKTKRWCQEYDRAAAPLAKKLENLQFFLEQDLPKGTHLMENYVRALEDYRDTILDTSPPPTSD